MSPGVDLDDLAERNMRSNQNYFTEICWSVFEMDHAGGRTD